jgi:hypothetical protein
MKANELRIGNYYNQFGNINQVNGHIISELEKAPQGQLWCKPIPLTEEWLLKMGGKKVNNLDWCIMFGGIEFYCRYNKFWYCSIGSVYLSDRIQFVHQVQNLYFSITNQELTMK